MPSFRSNGVDIAYDMAGEGSPILLIHGFASNGRVNWWDTGWVKFLAESGFQVLVIDNRGHGRSEKLYDSASYSASVMAEDASNLLKHLGIRRAHVMGYSMGARIAAFLAISHVDQVHSTIFAGLAANMIRGLGNSDQVAEALEAPSATQVTDAGSRAFRLFAEHTGSDLKALAACMRSSRQRILEQDLAKITVPVLVVAGEVDEIAGPLDPLVKAIPNAKGISLARRNHMNAVGDKSYKTAVLDFLKSQKA